MALSPATQEPPTVAETAGGRDGYTVVARRYRPQRFEDVVGQDHVVQALRNAIRLKRVTHAYLFSGTRGVGKTSLARIFAKALNCVHGPTETPCNRCDICRAIAVGQDVDVIEIDGASNNGVEAVRELRQNAGLRPSRARFKIYYIDEVHMLSTGAFNALLKTLEEPPEHVKFFFATTEPNKIPVTVLSRCQRYDFAGITPAQIAETLAEICGNEGVQADADALATIARRAGGSMRDAQSLLEQMLSYGGPRLTAEAVHRALGIAPDDRVLDLLDALSQGDPAAALLLVESSAQSGVQPSDLLAGTLDFLRDAMVLKAGAGVPLLAASPSQEPRLRSVADSWPLDSILAAMQILDQAKGRLRGSTHGRIIVEMALARAARLEDLADLGELVGRLTASGAGDGSAVIVKKKSPPPDPVLTTPAPADPVASNGIPSPPIEPNHPPALLPRPEDAPGVVNVVAPSEADAHRRAGAAVVAAPPLELEAARHAWEKELGPKVGIRLAGRLANMKPRAIEPPHVLVVAVPHRYNADAAFCEDPEVRGRIEAALADALGQPVSIRFDREPSGPEPSTPPAPTVPRGSPGDLLGADPWVRNIRELFETPSNPVQIEYDDNVPDS